jgi:hypothetical protein
VIKTQIDTANLKQENNNLPKVSNFENIQN